MTRVCDRTGGAFRARDRQTLTYLYAIPSITETLRRSSHHHLPIYGRPDYSRIKNIHLVSRSKTTRSQFPATVVSAPLTQYGCSFLRSSPHLPLTCYVFVLPALWLWLSAARRHQTISYRVTLSSYCTALIKVWNTSIAYRTYKELQRIFNSRTWETNKIHEKNHQ